MDLSFLNSIFSVNLLIKIITLIVIAFYVIFTIVVLFQIKAMAKILHLPHAELILETIFLINIILAISLFLLAIVIL